MALDEARASAEAGEVPIGAVLVYRDEVLARGGNRTIRDCDPTAHAELVVLREAAQKPPGRPLNTGSRVARLQIPDYPDRRDRIPLWSGS